MTLSPSQNLIHDRNYRGHTQTGWLNSYHTFSFGRFQDPARMGFRSLRVINEDWVVPGAGFPTHGHQDMEILTYVLAGQLEHCDSLGNGAVIRPGDVQIMSAGTGISHSEFNPSPTEPTHLLQIWILPQEANLEPRYEQREFAIATRPGQFWLVAARDGRAGAVRIFQDIDLYAAVLAAGDHLSYQLAALRYGWLQIARGVVTLNEQELRAGDGVALAPAETLEISSETASEILLFDLV